MEIIDSHAHIYPQKIAEKATIAIGEFYDIQMENQTGSVENLLKDGSKIGVSKYVVHSVAVTEHQVQAINRFLKEQLDNHKEFIGFMALHQDMTEQQIQEEVDWCIENGFKGIKMHPDFQKFYVDGEKAQKIYKIVGDKLPILLHIGDARYDYSCPERLVRVAKLFPEVTFICAHMGGYSRWNEWEIYKGIENIYFDTCSSLPFISSDMAKQIIKGLGVDKFFFSTDFPMWDAKGEFERFNKIDLTKNERELILSKNLKKLLKIG